MPTSEKYIQNSMELSETDIKQKMAKGMVVLAIRRVGLQVIITTTNIFLARLLNPEIFGTFAILGFFITTFGLVANFGLGPALIQKHGVVTTGQLRAIFTAVLAGALIFAGIIFFLAPVIDIFYGGKLGSHGIFWLRLFSLSVVFDHMATVSAHLLQRELAFSKFTAGEIGTILTTEITTIALVASGVGLGGLVLGNLIGKSFGVILYFALRPWPIGLTFRFRNLSSYISFGLNFQATNLIAGVNSAVTPLLVGRLTGPAAVGFVNWAGGVRSVALSPFEVVEKVIFPGAARAQTNMSLLKNLTEKLLRLSALFSFPLVFILLALVPEFIKLVYTEKWLGGILTLQLSLVQGVFLLIGTVLINTLLAIGKSREVRNIWIFWTILQWALTIPLVIKFGFNGVVIAGILVSATFFVPLGVLTRYAQVRFWPSVLPYLLYSLLSGLGVFALARWWPIISLFRLVTAGGMGALGYLVLLLVFERWVLFSDLLRLKQLTLYEK